MILLSKKEIPPHFGQLYSFLNFWNTSANAFYLPFGMMSPTLHDMAIITDLLVDGDKVSFLHDALGMDLGFQINKKNSAYSTFINAFNRGNGPVGETKHKAFLLFWIYWFFAYTSSVVVVVEFALYMSTIS